MHEIDFTSYTLRVEISVKMTNECLNNVCTDNLFRLFKQFMAVFKCTTADYLVLIRELTSISIFLKVELLQSHGTSVDSSESL